MKSKVIPSARLRLTQLAAAMFMATTLVACGGGGSGDVVVDKPGLGLYTTAPGQITITAGTSSSYTIGGGGGSNSFVTYKASSSNEQVATVAIDKSSLVITGRNGGTAIINVVDSAGGNVVINVTVPSSADSNLAIAAPSSVTLTPGNAAQYKINGGTGPFTSVASNPHVVSVAAGANAISVTAANPGTSTVVVYDALGASTKFDVTVSGSDPSAGLYTTAPEAFFMPANSTATYTIAGGLAPYAVTSANTEVIDASVDGGVLTVHSKGIVGKAAVNIRDAKGTLVVVTANVSGDSAVPLYTTAPSSISIGLGEAPAYTIQGGVGPFTAASSNVSVAKASVTGNSLSITGLSAGVADVVIFDSTGASVKVTATVQGGTATVPLYSTAPESITVAVGAAPTYTIAGGASPYTVISSNVNVITATQTGTTFTAKGISSGLATITIHDANGTAVNIMVTVQ